MDSRFDVFLTDPAFEVSQLHREYREAGEFLNFMRRRRAPLFKSKAKVAEVDKQVAEEEEEEEVEVDDL